MSAERLYEDTDGNKVTLDVLCMREPAWAANRIRATTAALADVFALIDEGFLVRNTANDHEGGWAIKVLPYMRRLADAQKQLPSASGDPK